MTAALHKYTVKKGDVFKTSIIYKQSSGTPFDVNGYSAVMQVRNEKGGNCLLLNLSTPVEITIPLPTTQGRFDVLVGVTAMSLLDPGIYWHTFKVIPSDPEQAETILEGVFEVTL